MKRRMNLQIFAEDPGTPGASGPESKPEAKGEGKPDNKPEARYTDADLDRILSRKFAQWQEKQQKAVDEAKKLAEMNAQQKAEYERDSLKKELDSYKKKDALAEMTKTARKMLADDGINIPDDLLSMMVSTEAEETKKAIDSFSKVYKAAVDAAVKERLKGEPPKRGVSGGTGGSSPAMTKEQIMAIKDHELRQRKMLENKELFNKLKE